MGARSSAGRQHHQQPDLRTLHAARAPARGRRHFGVDASTAAAPGEAGGRAAKIQRRCTNVKRLNKAGGWAAKSLSRTFASNGCGKSGWAEDQLRYILEAR